MAENSGNSSKKLAFLGMCLTIALMAVCSSVWATEFVDDRPIILKTMGSLMFGGRVIGLENGETFHGDHGYAQYFIPQNAREYPLVMWHGLGQSGKTWETTPDGRDGYMQIFTRRDWPVYIIDQPGRGRAGRTQLEFPAPSSIPTTAGESGTWNAFRLGIWDPPKSADFFPNVQFPKDRESIGQFMRWQTPDTGINSPIDANPWDSMSDEVAKLFERIGPGILITHSASGSMGWMAVIKAPELVKGIVAYEPGGFSFPDSEHPADLTSSNDMASNFAQPRMIPINDFKKLTRMPIMIVYGDNIISSSQFTIEFWRLSLLRAKQFVEAVNHHGGDAQLVVLPEIGINGNTHFPFADLNNVEIADQLSEFLKNKKLDGSSNPHKGPWTK
jgi:pimeloyl-ACP methyl ester carboxylesterase